MTAEAAQLGGCAALPYKVTLVCQKNAKTLPKNRERQRKYSDGIQQQLQSSEETGNPPYEGDDQNGFEFQ